jgi:hypothetical protein
MNPSIPFGSFQEPILSQLAIAPSAESFCRSLQVPNMVEIPGSRLTQLVDTSYFAD